MIEFVSAISLWELIKHTSRWVSNLKRAKDDRKQASVDALRKVILASQKTAIYLRQINETGQKSHEKEAELAQLWTELSFALDDLKVHKLAKRCLINGKKWAHPESMDKAFLSKADASLARVEQLANQLLASLKS